MRSHSVQARWSLAVILYFFFFIKAQTAAVPEPFLRLNITLNGRVRQARPLAEPCFKDPASTECSNIKKRLDSGWIRTSNYAGFQYLQGEACAADPGSQCLLDPNTLAMGGKATCQQGVLSPHFIEVKGPADVQAAFTYARNAETTLSIKNSGHDYGMRSSRQGSLALWTRNLRGMIHHPSFIPTSCPNDQATQAITFESGVSAGEALEFAHQKGLVFAAPGCTDVGAAGGYLLNGGHSVLSGILGLAIDRVLQFKIVTPDGLIRVANSCQDKDLFWALRGGGGGSFGVVLEATYLAETDKPVIGAFMALAPLEGAITPFLNLLAEQMPEWVLQGWGGVMTPNTAFLLRFGQDLANAKAALEMTTKYVEGQGGMVQWTTYPTFYDYYVQNINGTLRSPARISTAQFMTSRTVPRDILAQAGTRKKVVDTILNSQAAGHTIYMFAATPMLYGRSHRDRGTSIHPAWYDSVWHVVSLIEWPSTSTMEQRRTKVSELRGITQSFNAMAPNGATYSNEADPWLEDWQSHFWGENYKRLLKLKHSVDPDHILSCWHCVGWEESLPGYECTSGFGTS
jgi:hypothetical protein